MGRINPIDYPTMKFGPIELAYGVSSFEELAKKSTNPQLLDVLADEKWNDANVCCNIAKNKNTSQETVKKLFSHKSRKVIEALAGRSDLDEKKAYSLSFCRDTSIIISLARVTPYDRVKRNILMRNYRNCTIIGLILAVEVQKPKQIFLGKFAKREFLISFFESAKSDIISEILERDIYFYLPENLLKFLVDLQMKRSDLHIVVDVLKHQSCKYFLRKYIYDNKEKLNLNEFEKKVLKALE